MKKLKTKLIYWLLGKDIGIIANCKIDEHSLVVLETLAEKHNKKLNYINVEVISFEKD